MYVERGLGEGGLRQDLIRLIGVCFRFKSSGFPRS